MDITKIKGNLVELQCIMKFMSMGFECSMPYGDSAKYDIIVDIGDELLRVQCKKSRWIDNKNSIIFSCVSQTTNTQKTTRHSYTGKQIDYFATCWEDNVYLVPVDECSQSKSLRITPVTDKTPSNVNLAEDYLVEKILGQFATQQPEDFEEQVPIKIKEIGAVRRGTCPICGKPSSKEDEKCLKCYLEQKSAHIPTREELKVLIREHSFVEIGRMYNVSDNAIRKWCDKRNLPRKKAIINKMTEEEWNLL